MNRIVVGNAKEELMKFDGGIAQCCVTSPPYFGLRDYGNDAQIGLEKTPREYVDKLVGVFGLVRRILRDDGVLWLNVGDSYAGGGGFCATAPSTKTSRSGKYGLSGANMKSPGKVVGCKSKDLIGIPWMLAFALRDAGWYLRQEIVWEKGNSMPESCRDRCARNHEQLFLLSKSPRYFFDQYALRRQLPGGSSVPRSVWAINTKPSKEAHFAVMPSELARRCILAGSSSKGCCPACFAPYERQLKYDRVATRPGRSTKVEGKSREEIGNRDPGRHVTSVKFLGWKKTCNCKTEKVTGCLVIDPFMGSGTTAVTAKKLNRRYGGCEVNSEYAAIAERRLAKVNTGFGLGV